MASREGFDGALTPVAPFSHLEKCTCELVAAMSTFFFRAVGKLPLGPAHFFFFLLGRHSGSPGETYGFLLYWRGGFHANSFHVTVSEDLFSPGSFNLLLLTYWELMCRWSDKGDNFIFRVSRERNLLRWWP